MGTSWFGTDGIRDVAGEGRLSAESLSRIGHALGRFLAARVQGRAPRVLFGRDPRPSGPALLSGLATGLAAEGVMLEDAGLLPTPALAFALARNEHDLGLMLSASHNPPAYNGIKPFLPGGRKMTPDEEAAVEHLVDKAPPTAAKVQVHVESAPAWVERYVTETTAWLAPHGALTGTRVVVDLAAGAATPTASALLEALGAVVVTLHPAGSRPINDACGSEHPEAWLEAVRGRPGWVGMALDGDADRVLLADETGELLDGDDLLSILAREHVAFDGAVPGGCVVGTVMSNLGLQDVLARDGVELVRAAVGDRHVADRMRERGAALGGEPSGHVVLARSDLGAPPPLIGDAVAAGVRVLQAARRLGRPLSAWRADRPRHPQRLVNVRMQERIPLDGWAALRDEQAALEAKAAGGLRFVVRYSGTEPLLRIMAEGRDARLVDEAVERLAAIASTSARA
ncbi:MAG: phosphoglucosamine mutase [Planctomycetota bacterium]